MAMLGAAQLALLAATVAGSSPSTCDFNLHPGVSCTATAFKWTNETTADACCADCAATADCKAWEWAAHGGTSNRHKGNCHLKNEPGSSKHMAGTTCGISKSIPQPPMPPPPPPPPAPLPPAPPAPKGSPNIVWFLTDDQDQKLGGSFPQHNGVGPMPKAKALLADKGATATQWFIHTPICCPSRSELVSGMYFHNLKGTQGGCMHIDENKVNNQTFALYLHQRGYTVGMFGKYLNTNPKIAPLGIDAYMTNGGGTYTHPHFDTTGVSDLAPYYMADGGWQGNYSDYTTAVVGNTSLSWIKKVAKGTKPFFVYIAPKACHEPFTPASWYADHWDPSWPSREPRPVSWNCSAASRANHHGVIKTNKMIDEKCANYVTTSFKNRWRSLMSVDDVIAETVQLVEDEGLADNTYFLYSSDHGFQLGEFNILIDKRQMYDHDIRIHLLARGPGIAPGSTFPYPGTQVDMAPTWLSLVGLPKPAHMDGKSITPLLIDATVLGVPTQTVAGIKQLAPQGKTAYGAAWRDSIFIEYYYNSRNAKCENYPTESDANNFIGIRHFGGSDPVKPSKYGDTSYTEYQTGNQADGPYGINFTRTDFVEFFNLTWDTWQMNNLWHDPATSATQQELRTKLHAWFACAGDNCP